MFLIILTHVVACIIGIIIGMALSEWLGGKE